CQRRSARWRNRLRTTSGNANALYTHGPASLVHSAEQREFPNRANRSRPINAIRTGSVELDQQRSTIRDARRDAHSRLGGLRECWGSPRGFRIQPKCNEPVAGNVHSVGARAELWLAAITKPCLRSVTRPRQSLHDSNVVQVASWAWDILRGRR